HLDFIRSIFFFMKVSGEVSGRICISLLLFSSILAQYDAAYFCFAIGRIKNEVLISFTVDNALYYVCAADLLRPARVSHL
ncbi:hypothetical protein ACS6IR_04860, partial [Enterobacter hormaechei subsp. hoffmannii]|uniref:hypothetical protein n=1 Tax=Enterobacter hormaechei TaxID=158836 RepID=UPI003F423B3F